MDASHDFKSLQERVQAALVASTRTVNRIAGEDLGFQRTVNPAAGEQLDETSSRLLELSGSLLKSAAREGGQKVPQFEDADDLDVAWPGIVDVIDSLLEKADTCLAEYTGLIKRKDAPTLEAGGPQAKKPKPSGRLEYAYRRANIDKPQDAFEHRPDNFAEGPWKPILTKKPHAKLPLATSLQTFTDENDENQYRHPYETEILEMKYPKAAYKHTEPISYLPVETTAATWVDSYEGVLEMLEELKKAKEIAVDLEHHDFRTYEGLLSLMQISTRERDWIVDTLKPWRHRLEVLNEVFADPSIIKVFHGAQSDIIWLQRDLGLYIVGLFDTYFACEGLGYPGRSLAYLLKRFVDFDADKKYQMADWRIRPLPEEMFYYARSDTHYLLYVYDKVRNELVDHSDQKVAEKNLIQWALQKSNEVSLLRHEAQRANPETGHGPRGWFNSLTKSPSALGSESFAVYRAVHKWRDDVARREDESPFFLFTQQTLGDIARVMPTDKKALWSLLHNPAPVVKQSIDELFSVIQDARIQGVSGPTMMDLFRADTAGPIARTVFSSSKDDAEDRDQDVPSTEALKSGASQLWGPVPISSVWDAAASEKKQTPNGEQIALPWTGFVQGVIAQASSQAVAAAPEKVRSSARPEQDKILLEPEEGQVIIPADQEFTLRAGRRQRQAQTQRAEVPSESDDTSSESSSDEAGSDDDAGEGTETPKSKASSPKKKTNRESRRKTSSAEADDADPEAEEAAAAKAEARAARKAEKEARKANKAAKEAKKEVKRLARQVAEAGRKANEGQEPFDYSKAESVLHAKRASGDVAAERAGGRVFDPYVAKTGDAPKGARRMVSERVGKSATFRK